MPLTLQEAFASELSVFSELSVSLLRAKRIRALLIARLERAAFAKKLVSRLPFVKGLT